MKHWRKVVLVTGICIVTIIILAFVFLSPITKWAIEKYSPKYVGRQIKMEGLFLNLFTGSMNVTDMKIYEKNNKAVFFKVHELYANITLRKLLSSVYEINEVKINKPEINIIQKGNHFNYDDLIEKFSSKETTTSTKKQEPVKYYLRNFHIDSAIITYINTSPYNKIQIVRTNVQIPLVAWNNPAYNINVNLGVATGGEIDTKANFNSKSLRYNVALNIKQFNINPFYVYLKDYLKVNSLNGLLSTKLNLHGNMHKATDIAAKGDLVIEKFAVIDNTNDLLAAIDKMDVQIDSINTAHDLYKLQIISLQKPFCKLAMYDNGYNFNRLTTSPSASGTDTSSSAYSNPFALIAGYINSIVKDYVANSYSADKITIENGKFIFIDYTLHQKFQYNLTSLNVLSDRISNNNTKILFELTSNLNRSGKIKATVSINPKDAKQFSIDANLTNLLVSDFNPYATYYVATPFVNGIASYANKTNVDVRHNLKSDNNLVIKKIIAGKKDKTFKPQYNMPVRLAVSLLRDVRGDIKLNIPVAGSLDDPKFKWGKVVWQALGNIIVKAATAPFRLLANIFGGKEDDYKEINFSYLQNTLAPQQQNQLNSLVKALKQKADLKLELVQINNIQDEMELLALQQAKKKYLHIDTLTEAAQQQINKLGVRDSLFNQYLNQATNTNAQAFLSTQEKSILLIGKDNLQQQINNLMQQRNQAIANYLMQQQIPQERFIIHNSDKKASSLHSGPKYAVNIAVDGESSENDNSSTQTQTDKQQ